MNPDMMSLFGPSRVDPWAAQEQSPAVAEREFLLRYLSEYGLENIGTNAQAVGGSPERSARLADFLQSMTPDTLSAQIGRPVTPEQLHAALRALRGSDAPPPFDPFGPPETR